MPAYTQGQAASAADTFFFLDISNTYVHALNLRSCVLQILQNKVEADGGGLRDPEAVLREPHRREPAAEARARAAAAVGGGRALRAAPAAGGSAGEGHHMPVLRQGHRDDERRRDKQQELQQLFLLISEIEAEA